MTSTKNIMEFFGVSSDKLEDRIKNAIEGAILLHLPADINDRNACSKIRDYINRYVQRLLDEETNTAQCVCVSNAPKGNPWTFITRIYLNNDYDSSYKCSVSLSGISDVEIIYETSSYGAGSAWE